MSLDGVRDVLLLDFLLLFCIMLSLLYDIRLRLHPKTSRVVVSRELIHLGELILKQLCEHSRERTRKRQESSYIPSLMSAEIGHSHNPPQHYLNFWVKNLLQTQRWSERTLVSESLHLVPLLFCVKKGVAF